MNKTLIKSKNVKIILVFILLFSILVNKNFFSGSVSSFVERDIENNLDSLNRFDWSWSIPEVVSTESEEYSHQPSIAVDSLGDVHCVWTDSTDYAGAGTDEDIFYKWWDASSSTWSAAEIISTEGSSASNSPSIAVDSSDTVHVVWSDSTNYLGAGVDQDVFYRKLHRINALWSAIEVVSTESLDDSKSPTIAIDSLQNIHVSWSDISNYNGSGTDEDIFYKRFNVSSSSWAVTEVVSTESTLSSTHPSIAVDNLDNIHVTWTDGTNYEGAGLDADIFYKRFNASSYSWSLTEVVSTESTQSISRAFSVSDSSGNIHIVWEDDLDYDSSGVDDDIFYKQWNSSSSTWIPLEVVSIGADGSSLWPSIVVDSEGDVHVAWSDSSPIYRSEYNYRNIVYSSRSASTSSWRTAEVVSKECYYYSDVSSIGVDSLGRISIAWEDSTNFAGAGIDTDIFFNFLTGTFDAPNLAVILPNPTSSSSVFLDWNDVFTASNYFVYRSSSYIWSTEDLVPIAYVSLSEYSDTVPSEGFYYYAVVATDGIRNSSISNCEYTEYRISHVPELNIISNILLGFFVVSLVIMKIRRNRFKRASTN